MHRVSSTFFFQLTDATPLYFELGQVGSFGSTRGKINISITVSCLGLQSMTVDPPLHGGPRLVVYIQNDGLRVTGKIASGLDLDL